MSAKALLPSQAYRKYRNIVLAVYKAADEAYHETHDIFASPTRSSAKIGTITALEFPCFAIVYLIQLPLWAAASTLAYVDDDIALCRPVVVAYSVLFLMND